MPAIQYGAAVSVDTIHCVSKNLDIMGGASACIDLWGKANAGLTIFQETPNSIISKFSKLMLPILLLSSPLVIE